MVCDHVTRDRCAEWVIYMIHRQRPLKFSLKRGMECHGWTSARLNVKIRVLFCTQAVFSNWEGFLCATPNFLCRQQCDSWQHNRRRPSQRFKLWPATAEWSHSKLMTNQEYVHVDNQLFSFQVLPPPWPYNVDGVPTPFGRFTGNGEEHCVTIAHPGPCPDIWSGYCLSFICGRKLWKYYPWVVCLLFL